MPYETSSASLNVDLADPLFSCYVYVGADSDVGWKNAVYCHALLTQVNIYIFQDHTHLKPWVGNKKPHGIAFGFKKAIKQTLSKSEANDLGTVLQAMVAAQ